MVVVKQGDLPPPGKQYRLYLNADRKRNKWYLRVTHSFPHTNRHFRAGTYDSKEDALKAAETLDPINPKKGRSKPGTVDRYSNGMWRVRVKYKGEHMHVGYYRDEQLAKSKLQEALADPSYLEERYQSLLAKRRRKTHAKKEKQKRTCDRMEGFDQFDPVSKRHYQRQNIISPIANNNVLKIKMSPLPKLSPVTTNPSIEDYNAFLSAEQQQSHPARTPDYPHLYHKFLKQEKVKKERSFNPKPMKNEFVLNAPLEWCEFSPFTLEHGASQLQSQPTIPPRQSSFASNSQPQPPSFKATIVNDPTARYLDSTIPETLQQMQMPLNQNTVQRLAHPLRPVAPQNVGASPYFEENGLPSRAHLKELASALAEHAKYRSFFPVQHQPENAFNSLAQQYTQMLTNNQPFL